MDTLIFCIKKTWRECVKENAFVAKELDKQGFSIHIPQTGKLIVEHPLDPIYKDKTFTFKFHTEEAEAILLSYRFYLLIDSHYTKDYLIKHVILGTAIVKPKFELHDGEFLV